MSIGQPCWRCLKPNPAGVRFCRRCGTALLGGSSGVMGQYSLRMAPAASPSPPTVDQQPWQHKSRPTRRPRRMVLTAMVALAAVVLLAGLFAVSSGVEDAALLHRSQLMRCRPHRTPRLKLLLPRHDPARRLMEPPVAMPQADHLIYRPYPGRSEPEDPARIYRRSGTLNEDSWSAQGHDGRRSERLTRTTLE